VDIEGMIGKLTKDQTKEMLRQLIWTFTEEELAEVLKETLSETEKEYLVEDWGMDED
jgi:hypothetical protein